MMSFFTLFRDFRANLNKPIECQKEELAKILEICKLPDYKAFVEKFPVAKYDDLVKHDFYKEHFANQNEFYVRSSGTTSDAKHIPISKKYLVGNHLKVAKYCVYNLITNFKQYHIIRGLNLVLSGYVYPGKYNNTPVYDISALINANRPSLYKYLSYPYQPYYNWESKLTHLKQNYKEIQESTSISGVPTWMFSLFNSLQKDFNNSIRKLFPKLKLVIHGGVDFSNYYKIFKNCFNDRSLTFFETYNATEGFYGFQLHPSNKKLVLSANANIFYEFKNSAGVFPAWEVKPEETYELVISNLDGLIRYCTGDLITIHSIKPFLFTITGRTTEFINAFGEDLLLIQANTAMQEVTEKHNLHVIDYFVVPHYSSEQEIGYHEWYLFLDKPLENKEEVIRDLDDVICRLNNNYRQKRHSSLALQSLRLFELTNQDYSKFFTKQRKNQGGQAKLKKLHNDRLILNYLNSN